MPEKDRSVVANLQYGGRYKTQLAKAAESGECIFCSEAFQRDPQYFCFEARKWIARRSEYPTLDTEGGLPAHHFLIIPERHFCDWRELSSRDHRMIDRLIQQLRETYQIKGGGLFHRLGAYLESGATILHFHLHFVVPRVKLVNGVPTAIPVYMPIG